ncbi:MAG: FadR family transcriptional regulator [Zoogloeaceae bacterium]|nr:FadR family transcriptional regulator [Rhodocyclaceae bacterium]MCP5234984.1 FadR family transcriptional regulator [Zoogloeaceae bacterium]
MPECEHLPRPPRLADTLSRSLQDWVRDRRLAEGDRLPTEKQLCEHFGVSRAVVREAIARLQADGYVETRQGLGAFVAVGAGVSRFRIDRADGVTRGDGLREVFELRQLMESGIAELAAARRSESDLSEMRMLLGRMEEALVERQQASELDDAFHLAIAAATRNPLLVRFMEFMGAQIQSSRVPTWDDEGHVRGLAAAAHDEHQAMYRAIADGDVMAARLAAAGHLQAAAERLGLAPGEGRSGSGRVGR